MTELPQNTDSQEQVGRDATQVYRESQPEVPRNRFAHLRLLLLSCGGAAVALAILTVLQWFPSHIPLLAYLGLVVLPASLYVVWRGHSENMAILRTFLVYAMLISIPLAAWNVGLYRSGVYYLTGWSLPKTTLLVAMKERSERVAVQACVHLLGEETLMEDAILPTLRVRSAVASECLNRVAENDFPTANSISRVLSALWYDDLAHSASVPSENGCAIAESVDSVARIAELEGAPTLLQCALSSPQAETAQCCARVLSSQFPAASNPDVRPGLLEPDARQELFGALIRMVDPTPQQLLETAPSNSTVDWPSALFLHWTARLGCSLVESSEQRDRFAGELARITATQCGLDVEKSLHTFETITLVKNTCEPFLEKAARGEVEPVTLFDWCASARIAARSTAAEAASFAIHQSISVRNVQGLASSIDMGGNQIDIYNQSSGVKFLNEFNEVFNERGDSENVAVARPSWANELSQTVNTPALSPAQERARQKRIEQRKQQILSGGTVSGAAPAEESANTSSTTSSAKRSKKRGRNRNR